MKFFILCAGLGKRISKYSNNKPKCLIKYLDKPLLEHWINKFNTKKNVLLINKHYQYKHIDNFIKNIQTRCEVNTVYEEKLLGSLGTIIKNVDYIKKTKNFVVVYSDSFSKFNFSEFYKFHLKHKSKCTLLLYKTNYINESGIAHINKNNKIIKFIEKPKFSKSNLASAGIYIINTKYFINKLKYKNFNFPIDLSKDFIENSFDEDFFGYVTNSFIPFGNNKDYENIINSKCK